MKRFTLRQLVLCCAISGALTVGVGISMKATGWHLAAERAWHRGMDRVFGQAEPAPSVDHHPYLLKKDAHYRSLPPQSSQERRLADQAKLLADYEADPAAFLRQYQGVRRTYLFDAVIDGKNLFRTGTYGDGGKWVSDPDSLRPGAVVYSFGVGGDFSFDLEMAGLFGCEVHAFDPGPSVVQSFANCPPGQASGKGTFSFHPVGLGPTSLDPGQPDELILEGRECPVKRLSEIAAELGHPRVDVLKMDIEGGEMPALMEILSSGTLMKLSVEQLLVECHFWDDEHWSAFVRIVGLLRKQGFLIFRKEFNPFDTRCAEFAFLRSAEAPSGKAGLDR